MAEEISQGTWKKLQLYAAAMFLFEKGRSHPQIMEELGKFEPDRALLLSVVDNAMTEKWDKLYEEAKRLFSEGKTYGEVLALIAQSEPDEEIAGWICGSWYHWKTQFVEMLIDGEANRNEGLKGIIISLIGVAVMYYINAGWIGKTLWLLALVGSSLLWLLGQRQRSISRKIAKLFAAEEGQAVAGRRTGPID